MKIQAGSKSLRKCLAEHACFVLRDREGKNKIEDARDTKHYPYNRPGDGDGYAINFALLPGMSSANRNT